MKPDKRISLDMSGADSARRGFRGETVFPISKALPLYKGKNAKYVHRVRGAMLHTGLVGKLTQHGHVSISFWCGGGGCVSEGKGKLMAEVSDGEVLCATCEGRWAALGLDGSGGRINGRRVMYTPRKYE